MAVVLRLVTDVSFYDLLSVGEELLRYSNGERGFAT